MSTIYKPLCLKCNKRAEDVVFMPAIVDNEIRVKAYCHGEEFTITGVGYDLNPADLMLKTIGTPE